MVLLMLLMVEFFVIGHFGNHMKDFKKWPKNQENAVFSSTSNNWKKL